MLRRGVLQTTTDAREQKMLTPTLCVGGPVIIRQLKIMCSRPKCDAITSLWWQWWRLDLSEQVVHCWDMNFDRCISISRQRTLCFSRHYRFVTIALYTALGHKDARQVGNMNIRLAKKRKRAATQCRALTTITTSIRLETMSSCTKPASSCVHTAFSRLLLIFPSLTGSLMDIQMN